MSAEVAVRQLMAPALELEREGTSLEAFLLEHGLPGVELSDVFARIDWQHYIDVLDALADHWGFDKMTRVGAQSVEIDAAQEFRDALLFEFDSASEMLRTVLGPAGTFSTIATCMEYAVLDEGAAGVTVRVSPAPGYRCSESYYRYGAGVLQALPTVLFERAAEVEIELLDNAALYHLHLAAPRMQAGLRRRLERSRTMPGVARRFRQTFGEIAARQQQLQEAKLKHLEAELRLARADKLEALGNLTGGIAHDFNNLMAIVMGQLELLSLELEDPEHLAQVQDALAAVARGKELTGQLLAFGRRAQLRPKVLSANDVVRDTQAMLIRTLGEDVAIETALDPELWPSRTDRGQLENALVNLALNARDAMPGGGKLRVTTSNTTLTSAELVGDDAEPGDYISIAVRIVISSCVFGTAGK